MVRKAKGSEVVGLALESALTSGSTEEMLDAARTVLALRVLDPERRDTASLVRELRAVEAQQTALRAPVARDSVDELRARREGAAGRGA